MEPRTRMILIVVGVLIMMLTAVPIVFLVGGSGGSSKAVAPPPASASAAMSVSSLPPQQQPQLPPQLNVNTTPLAIQPVTLQTAPMTLKVPLGLKIGPAPPPPRAMPSPPPRSKKIVVTVPPQQPSSQPSQPSQQPSPPSTPPSTTQSTTMPSTQSTTMPSTQSTTTPHTQSTTTPSTRTTSTSTTQTTPSTNANKFPSIAGGKVLTFTPAQVVAFKGSCGGKCVVAGDAVAVTMQPGLPSPSTGGMKKRTAAPPGALEILSEFEVRFGEPGKPFDFVKGGKASVLGFQFGTGESSGGEWSASAASARLMFRRGGAASLYMYYGKSDTSESGINNISDQQPEYAKIAKPTGTAGHSMWEAGKSENPLPAFKPGQWHKIAIYGRMNTAAKYDGVVGMSVDGSTRTYTKMRWMDKPAPLTDLTAAVFFGGSDSTWNPPVASTIYFRNFRVTTTAKPGPLGPMPISTPTQQPANKVKAAAAATGGGKKWTDIQLNRFGDYALYGQGSNWKTAMKTVTCTGVPGNYDGFWTAMNVSKFGLTTVPCGTKLKVTAGGKSVNVVVADGGGSEGLDLDDRAYKTLFSSGDGLRPGGIVEQL